MNRSDSPSESAMIRVGQLEIRYLQEAGNGCQIGCFELRVPPASNVPPQHSHAANEELVVVLEGTLRYTVAARAQQWRPVDPATIIAAVRGKSLQEARITLDQYEQLLLGPP